MIYLLTYLLPKCWALPKADARKIDALDQWCLRRIYAGISMSNREVQQIT